MSQHRLLTEALRIGFPTAKHLALAGGFSVQSAVRYRRGETYPDVFTTARLMRHSRAVADAMLKLAGLDDLSLELEQARLARSFIAIEAERTAQNAALAKAYKLAGRDLPASLREEVRSDGSAAETAPRQTVGAVAPVRTR
jgi:hypothetical protein